MVLAQGDGLGRPCTAREIIIQGKVVKEKEEDTITEVNIFANGIGFSYCMMADIR